MTAPMKAIDVYEDIGPAYQIAFHKPPAQIRSVQWLLSQLDPASKIVDIGCGTGRPVCEMLAEAGHHVIGVDFSPKMVETARSQVPAARILKGDALSWEPAQEDRPFDAVTSYFAFLGGTKQEDSRKFFKRAYSWLRPDGVFIFGLVPLDWEEVEITWLGRKLVTSTLSADDAKASIKAAGFNVEHEESVKFRPKAVEAGLCKEDEIDTETHLFLYARKPAP
ncbi:hypothetical protein LTR86_004955 [Recurvomyces mirabilis]|nr:hypothetical protein LTR86_004955 [Recurvomyces mirabilis]